MRFKGSFALKIAAPVAQRNAANSAMHVPDANRCEASEQSNAARFAAAATSGLEGSIAADIRAYTHWAHLNSRGGNVEKER